MSGPLDRREPIGPAAGFIRMPPDASKVFRLADIEAFEPETDLPLDPGVRRYVLILRSQGVETFESCEGGEGHAYPQPTVRFDGNAYEGFRAFAVAMNYGLPVRDLRRVYDVIDGQLVGPWWEMTFRTTDQGD